jgi:hypothetical protein
MHGNFGREITKYTVIYGVYIQFWPTLVLCEENARQVVHMSMLLGRRWHLLIHPLRNYKVTIK